MAEDAEEPKRSLPPAPPEEAAPAAEGLHDPGIEEAILLSRKKSLAQLREEAEAEDHRRGEKFKDHFETLAIVAMYIMFMALSIFGIVWVLHIVLPETCKPFFYLWGTYYCLCRWLTPDQTMIVQDIVTGGLIAGLLADHFRRRIGR